MTDQQGRLKRVHIEAIHQDTRYQVRTGGTDLATVKRYATILRGKPKSMPPITLVEIDGRLTCVDGWHRIAAHRVAGIDWIEAIVVAGTERDALWMAASANLANPRPLTRRDLQQAFRMYVTARQYRTPVGRLKSYREIAGDFQNVVTHTTIRNWMERSYPAIFRAMRVDGLEEDDKHTRRRHKDDRAEETLAVDALKVAIGHIGALGPPRDRPAILFAISEAVRSMGLSPDWKPSDLPPF